MSTPKPLDSSVLWFTTTANTAVFIGRYHKATAFAHTREFGDTIVGQRLDHFPSDSISFVPWGSVNAWGSIPTSVADAIGRVLGEREALDQGRGATDGEVRLVDKILRRTDAIENTKMAADVAAASLAEALGWDEDAEMLAGRVIYLALSEVGWSLRADPASHFNWGSAQPVPVAPASSAAKAAAGPGAAGEVGP